MVKSAHCAATTFGLRMASASTRWLALWHPERSIAACQLNSSWILLDITGMLVEFSRIPAHIWHSRVKNGGSLQMLTRTWFPQTFFSCAGWRIVKVSQTVIPNYFLSTPQHTVNPGFVFISPELPRHTYVAGTPGTRAPPSWWGGTPLKATQILY